MFKLTDVPLKINQSLFLQDAVKNNFMTSDLNPRDDQLDLKLHGMLSLFNHRFFFSGCPLGKHMFESSPGSVIGCVRQAFHTCPLR